jgi:hypothetical protein
VDNARTMLDAALAFAAAGVAAHSGAAGGFASSTFAETTARPRAFAWKSEANAGTAEIDLDDVGYWRRSALAFAPHHMSIWPSRFSSFAAIPWMSPMTMVSI